MPSDTCRSLFLLAALGSLGMVAGCRPATETNNVDSGAVDPPALPALPVADPPLDRAHLLQLVAQAASAAALGSSDVRPDRELDGARFELRIRFGCSTSPEPGSDERFAVRFDEKSRTLRLRATQDLTAADPWLAALEGDQVEAVEGFWLRRPWLLSAGCPVKAAPPQVTEAVQPNSSGDGARAATATPAAGVTPAPRPAGQRVGIAQFFTKADARTGRRGDRAYEATKVLAANEQPSRQGYDLVLSGRLTSLPSGQVIACRSEAGDAPPDCIISADIDRVRFEHPDGRAVIAEWSN